MAPLRLRIREIALFERLMPFARPFRFGVVTVAAAPQAFVRAVVEIEDHGLARGAAAEMMMPKWFDKDQSKTPDETVDDLRSSLAAAARAYPGLDRDTAFGLHAAALDEQTGWARGRGLPNLVAAYGPALVDKAVLDALLKATGLDLAGGLRANVAGLDARLTPDLDRASVESFLARIDPLPEVAIRHTIGLLDPLVGPDGLEAELARSRLRFFKIKLGGDLEPDLSRLRDIARLLARAAPDYRASLDANEQYDPDRLAALLDALDGADLAGLRNRLLYIEQPFDRAATFAAPLGALAERAPVVIDEADGGYDAFPRAAALDYRGVSSKSCKGVYKAILNAVRVARLNRAGEGRFLLTAEDLTCQAGLGLQQDTALVAALGLAHAERNGHHYVDGFGPAPDAEAQAFAAAHPNLYARRDGRVRLLPEAGALPTASLFGRPGFAAGAEPDWASLAPLSTPTALEEIVA